MLALVDARSGILPHRQPDATLEDRTHSRRLSLGVEGDQGEMTGAALAHVSARDARSREWARNSACERLAWACAETGLMIRTTTVSRLAQQGPLAPIWLAMLPNQPHPLRQPLLDDPQSGLR